MSLGCYGNCPEDRYFSKRLDDYLDSYCDDDAEVCKFCEMIMEDCDCNDDCY